MSEPSARHLVLCRYRGSEQWGLLTTCDTKHAADTMATRWIDNYPWPYGTEIKVFEEGERP